MSGSSDNGSSWLTFLEGLTGNQHKIEHATTSAESATGMTRIIFAMTGAGSLAGGIAAANLNVLRALSDLSQVRRESLLVLSLHEHTNARPGFLSVDVDFVGFGGNRYLYAFTLLKLSRLDALFVFDHVRLALPVLPLAALGMVRMVILAHGSEAWRRIRPTSKWLYRKATLCLANSHYTLRRMRETFTGFTGTDCLLGLSPLHGISGEGIVENKNPLALEAVDGLCRAIGKRMILLVARMDPDEREKGHAELVEIWPQVLHDFPEAQLVFAGPGEDRVQICACVERQGVADSVFVPGYLPVELLTSLYEQCYAFVMPSRQEGFGLVYLEAMNHGKPCVGCFDDGGEDVIVDGITGILLNQPLSTEELFAAVSKLLDDEVAAAEMGRRGRQRLLDQFTLEHAQARFKQRLATVLP